MGSPRERAARLRDESFLRNLEDLPIEEIRRRRDEALAEREYLSYLRRLLQVRIDIVNAELARRSGRSPDASTLGSDDEALVKRLSSVLAEGPQGRGRGEALTLNPPEDDMAEAERRADEAMGGAFVEPPQALDEEILRRALEGLQREERAVSEDRVIAFRAHDALQGELKRRYREDPSQIPIAP